MKIIRPDLSKLLDNVKIYEKLRLDRIDQQFIILITVLSPPTILFVYQD